MNAVMQTRDGQCFQWVTFKRADKVCGLNVIQVPEVLRVTQIPCWVFSICMARGHRD